MTFPIRSFSLLLVFVSVSHVSVAQQHTSAREVLEANVAATGGKAAWEAIKDQHIEQQLEVQTSVGGLLMTANSWSVMPGHGYLDVQILSGPPMITAEMVSTQAYLTPDGGWMQSMQLGGRQDIENVPASMRPAIAGSSVKAEINLLALPDSALSLMGERTVGDKQVLAVRVVEDGSSSIYYYDPETLLLFAHDAGNVGAVRTFFTDYRTQDGVTYSFSQHSNNAPGGAVKSTILSIELNTGFTAEDLSEMASK